MKRKSPSNKSKFSKSARAGVVSGKARRATGKSRAGRPRSQRSSVSVTSEFERMLKSAAAAPQQYVLRLYVTGSTPRSTRAIRNIRSLCDRHLEGRYDLEIVDIYQQPTLASGDQIIAAPTLIRKLPAPLRKVIGDLSDEAQFLVGLDLLPRQEPGNKHQQRVGEP